MRNTYGAYVALAVLAVSGASLLLFWYGGPYAPSDTRTIRLDGNTISVSIADTDATRERGLGGRAGLSSDEGMLFIFQMDGRYAFWMKDMRFSIDILWLSANGTIVYIAPDISPDTFPNAFVPDTTARYVLELPAGYATAHGVRAGDRVQL